MNTFCILKRIVKRSVAACVMLSMAVVMHGQECPAIGLPFEEDFETFNATTKLPDCWTKWENFDVPEMKAHVVSTPVYAGNGALMMSCGANNDTAHICYVMGPVLSQSPSGIRLKAKFRATEAGAVVQVGVTKSTSSAQRHFGFTPVTTLTIPTANVWITYEIDFTSYTGDGDRPAFMMSQKMQNGHVARKVYIDEVALERCRVEGLSVSHRSSDELTLHWTSVGNGTANLRVQPVGGGSALTFNNVTSPYRITGLNPSTTYTLTLTPICAGEALPGNTESIDGTTLGGRHDGLVYCEDFESSQLPAGWMGMNGCSVQTSTRYSGSRALRLSGGGYAVMPQIALVNGTLVDINQLMLSMMMYGSSGAQLQVFATDYPEETETFVPITTLQISAGSSWNAFTVSLQNYDGNGRYLILKPVGNSTLYIDALRVGRCLLSGVALAGKTSTSATLEWDEPLHGDSVTLYPTTGGGATLTVGEGDCQVSGGKWRYTLDGLTAGSSHSWEVYGSCDAGHCGAASVSVTTFAADYPLPYCTDFEVSGSLPTDWQVTNSYSGAPVIDNSRRHSGSKSLKLSSYGGVSSSHSTVTLPPLSGNGPWTVSFAMQASHSGSTLQIGTVSRADDESTFTVLASVTPPAGEWQRVSVSVAAPGSGERLAMRYIHSSSGNRSVWIDDLQVAHCGIGATGVTGIRSTGATISWSTSAIAVDLQLRRNGVSLAPMEDVSSPLELTGLDEGTTYSYYLRSHCEDETGCWIYGGEFTTNSGALRADYCHGQQLSIGTSVWTLPYLEETSYSGLAVSFDAQSSSGNRTLKVGLMEDPADASSFTEIGSVAVNAGGWTHYRVLLTGHEGDGHYLALKSASGTVTVNHLRIGRGEVTDAVVSDLGATVATLSWTEHGEVDSVRVELTDNSTNSTVTYVVTTSSLTFQWLDAGSSYGYVLTALHGGSENDCSTLSGSFSTLEQEIGSGLCETFESTSSGLPTGWTVVENGSNTPAVVSYNGSRRLKLTSSGSQGTLVALPGAADPLTGLNMRIDAMSPSSNPEGSMLILGVMTSAGDAASFAPCDTLYPGGEWRNYVLEIGANVVSQRVLALKYVSPGATRTLYVDNLGLSEDAVGEPRVSELTNHSLRLSWSGAQNVMIRWGNGDWTWVAGEPSATGWSTVITGLESGTEYTFSLVPAFGDTTSLCRKARVECSTLSTAMMAPLCYGFEDYAPSTQLPVGWSRPYGASPVSQTGSRHSGSRALQFYAPYGSATVVSPMMETSSLDGLYLSFYHNTPSGSEIQVGVMSSPEDTASFTLLGSLAGTGSWTRGELLLAGVPTGKRYLAFRYSGSSYAYIDDLMLQECAMPTITLGNPHSHTIDVSWTGVGEIWLEYGTSESTMQRVRVSTSPYTLTGLASSTQYTVRAWCVGSEPDFECHKVEATMQTLSEAQMLNYCQSFDNNPLPADWSPVGNVTSSSNGHNGRSVQLVASSQTPAGLIMPELDVSDACTTVTTLYLQFSLYRNYGAGTLEVGTISDHGQGLATFSAVHTIDVAMLPTGLWTDTVLAVPLPQVAQGFVAFRLRGNAGIGIDDLCIAYCLGSHVEVTQQTPTTATIEWGGYGVSEIIVNWEGGSATATSSPYTITGLDPDEEYNFTAIWRCECNIFGHGGSGVISVQQPPDSIPLPQCYTLDEPGFPASWRRWGGYYNNYPQTATSKAYSSPRSLDLYTSNGHPSFFSLPPLADTSATVVLSGRIYCSNLDATTEARLHVGLTPFPQGTFTSLAPITVDAVDHWESFHIVITPEMRNNANANHITLRFSPSSTYHLYLDDISLTSCAVSSVTTDGETFTVQTLGSSSHYLLNIHNKQQNTDRHLILPGGTQSLASLALSPDSSYILSAHPLCSDSSASPCIEESLLIHQHLSLPYCNDFSSSTTLPDGWITLAHNDGRYPRIESGRLVLKPNTNNPSRNDLVLLPPIQGHTLGGLHVRIDITLSNSDRPNAYLELGYYSGGTFHPLATLNNTSNTQTHRVTLPACSASQLAIRAVATSGNRTVSIDNLQLSLYPEPSNLHLPQTGYQAQHIYWTDEGNARCQVEWGPRNFTPGTGTMVQSDSCHLSLAPLSPNTQYQFYFIDTNGNRFCYPHEFTSMAAAVPLPYCNANTQNLSANSLLKLPEVLTPLRELTILFTWRSNASNGQLVVGAMSDRSDDATFIPLDTLFPAAANTWQRDAVSLSNYADSGHFVALRLQGASGNIKDLTLQRVPQPTFHVLNSTTIEATVEGSSVDYWLRVGTGSQGGGQLHHVTTSPYHITGLEMYTPYNIYTLASGDENTCALPVTLRTHKDEVVPYCTSLQSGLPQGWSSVGPVLVQPYFIVDHPTDLHLYLKSRGEVTVGLVSALDDTSGFTPIASLSGSQMQEHYVKIDSSLWIVGNAHRYLSLRMGSGATVQDIIVQAVPRPAFHAISSSEIEAVIPDGNTPDYYVEVCAAGAAQGTGTLHHATTSPYVISGLAMYTHYDLYVQAEGGQATCAPKATVRTHKDIYPPYCENVGPSTEGWYTAGPYRVMPYTDVDTMVSVYVTFRSRGDVSLGSQSMLDDTSTFVSFATCNHSGWEEHTVRLADHAGTLAARHYIAFKGGEIEYVYLHQCPTPTTSLTAYNEVCFTLPADETPDYWVENGNTILHATTNPFVLRNLAENTHYSFHFRCDSTTVSCLPPAEVLTGVQISTPHCAPLGNYTFGLSGATDGTGPLPAGWRTLNGSGGARYAVMPIVDLDSVYPVYARFRYRIPQAGTILSIGVMTNPDDESTFVPVATMSNISSEPTTQTASFSLYRGDGRYIAFRATGSNASTVVLNHVELQTVPFATYQLVSHNEVLVSAPGMPQAARPFYIDYGDGRVAVDSLPKLITGLDDNRTYYFNTVASEHGSTCVPSTPVTTTYLAGTPLCGLSASLSGNAPLWCGPELDGDDIASLVLRTTLQRNNASARVIVGTMNIRNDATSFHPLDTLTLGADGLYTADLGRWTDGRFLALMLAGNSSGSVTLSNMELSHCLLPLSATLTLLRHNKVRLNASDIPHPLWVEYGPAGFHPGDGTIVRVDSLPMEFTLANSTPYEFLLRCDSLGGSCQPRLSISTLEAPPPLSWCADFNTTSVGTIPSSWQLTNTSNEYQNIRVVSSRRHTSPRSLYFNSVLGHSNIIVLPDLGLDDLRGLSLSLWMQADNTATNRLEVGVIFNPSDPETFQPLCTLSCFNANVWERKLADFADAPDSAFFIALRCSGTGGDNRFWIDDIHIAQCGAHALNVTDVQADAITLCWRQTGSPHISIDVEPDHGTPWTIDVDDTLLNGYRYYTVTGLQPLTNYTFAVAAACDHHEGFCTSNYLDTCRIFTPAGGSECIDPTNLNAPYTSCFYGSYGNPYAHQGIVNHGYASPLSRHTIHYDLSERDPRTGGLLKTVPDGSPASVRLGNWDANLGAPEAESIVYGLSVDTLDFDLLIMRYAAVLQDPMHSAAMQPRFSLELLNEHMVVVDSTCGRADFIANYNMGWNEADNDVLWKDWTTVGIDLTPYAGQTIYIRLTTRDCNEGSHYGYAYFTLECGNKRVVATGCGVIEENHLSVPSGFHYRWYPSNNPSQTLSTGQQITVASNNNITYLCNLSFVDNPSCQFTMSAFAGTRFPLSLMANEVTPKECGFDVTFMNRSTVSMDGVTPVGTGEGVENAMWYFGNGDSADTYHARTRYGEPGTYLVHLVTSIGGGACMDTLTVPLTLAFPPTGLRIEGATERCFNAKPDTLHLFNVAGDTPEGWELADSTLSGSRWIKHCRKVVDSVHYGVGTHLFEAEVMDTVGCLRLLTHSLTVHPVYSSREEQHICSLMLPLAWSDTTFGTGTTSGFHTLHRYTASGCDSILNLRLTVYDNTENTHRDTTRDALCDNRSYYFSDSLLTPDATLTHNGAPLTIVYTDSLHSSIGCDSLSTIVLTVHPTYGHLLRDTVCSNTGYTWGSPQRQTVVPYRAASHSRPEVEPPAVSGRDSVWTDTLMSVKGCDSLSSLELHIVAAYDIHHYDTVCGAHVAGFNADSTAVWTPLAYAYGTNVYGGAGEYRQEYGTRGVGSVVCDSVRTLHLEVWPTHGLDLYDTVYDGDTYTFEGRTYDVTGVYPRLYATVEGCDSVRTLHLQRNRRTYIDSVVCQNGLPVTWYGGRIFGEGSGVRAGGIQVMKDSVHLSGSGGIDSLLVMTLIVRDTATTTDIVHACDSLLWSHTPDTVYRVSTDTPYRRLQQLSGLDTAGIAQFLPDSHLLPFTAHLSPFAIQCDSVRHLNLTVDYTHYTTDYRIACDSMRWEAGGRYYYRDTVGVVGPLGSLAATGPVDTLVTAGGCDSVVNLDLAVRYSTYEEFVDTFCYGNQYTWRTQTAGEMDDNLSHHNHYYLTETLQRHPFVHPNHREATVVCDSVLAIRLTQMARPQLSIDDNIDCGQQRYRLTLETDMPYFRWEYGRTVSRDAVIDVSPSQNTLYMAYVDYHEQPLCPLKDSIALRPIVIPSAEMRVIPEALHSNETDIDAYDLTIVDARSMHVGDPDVWTHEWLVDGTPIYEESRHLNYTLLHSADSLLLSLCVYNGQCYDTVSQTVPILHVAAYAPDAFTPGEDNNNRFTIVTQGITNGELYIYNRQGLLVYQTTDLNTGWDGRDYNGNPCHQAAYVWKLIYEAIDHPGVKRSEVGTVTLLR